MREYKFRAWNGTKMIENITPWQHDFVLGCGHWKCLSSANDEGEAEFMVDGFLFNAIMQFTGLKDRNGKEIYEGDIVNCRMASGQYHAGECKYDPDKVSYGLNIRLPLWDSPALFEISGSMLSDFVVIGNIYENPEFLKGVN
jgi:uncharacterized phage protein (TIGR01671 family)